eukprot:COSAG01_NODE_10487_length_2153_cov_15.611490_3_plen_225_part_01
MRRSRAKHRMCQPKLCLKHVHLSARGGTTLFQMCLRTLNTQAGHLKIKCWSQNGSTRRKSVKEARQIARGRIGRRLRYALKNKGRLSTAQALCGVDPLRPTNLKSGQRWLRQGSRPALRRDKTMKTTKTTPNRRNVTDEDHTHGLLFYQDHTQQGHRFVTPHPRATYCCGGRHARAAIRAQAASVGAYTRTPGLVPRLESPFLTQAWTLGCWYDLVTAPVHECLI